MGAQKIWSALGLGSEKTRAVNTSPSQPAAGTSSRLSAHGCPVLPRSTGQQRAPLYLWRCTPAPPAMFRGPGFLLAAIIYLTPGPVLPTWLILGTALRSIYYSHSATSKLSHTFYALIFCQIKKPAPGFPGRKQCGRARIWRLGAGHYILAPSNNPEEDSIRHWGLPGPRTQPDFTEFHS